MARLKNRKTGVVVSVRDDKVGLPGDYEPYEAESAEKPARRTRRSSNPEATSSDSE